MCSESPCFSLDFTQKNVFASVWLSYNGFASFRLGCAVFSIIFPRTTFSSFFRYQTTLLNYAAFSLMAPKTCFCLLATKLGCFELYVACSLLKYGVLSFIASKTCFALFAVKLGIFQQFAAVNGFLFQFLTSDADFYSMALKTTF